MLALFIICTISWYDYVWYEWRYGYDISAATIQEFGIYEIPILAFLYWLFELKIEKYKPKIKKGWVFFSGCFLSVILFVPLLWVVYFIALILHR